MKRWTLACAFVAAFSSALPGTAPMSLALSWLNADEFGLSAADVSGTIWSGRLKEARYRAMPLGDVEVALDPLALLAGTRRAAVRGPLGKVTLVQGAVHGFENADAAMAVEHLRLAPGLTGHVRLEKAAMLFSDGRCARAEGRMATDVLERAFGGPEISGDLSCAGDAAIAQLQGLKQDIAVRVVLRLDARGRYQAETHIASTSAFVRGALALAGFAERADGFVRLDEGVIGS